MNGYGEASTAVPGAVADLVAIEGDPLVEPDRLAEPALVVVGGAVRVRRRAS